MLSDTVACAVQLLAELDHARRVGKPFMTQSGFVERCGFNRQLFSVTLMRLRRAGWIDKIPKGISLSWRFNFCELNLYQLVMAVDGSLQMGGGRLECWPVINRKNNEHAKKLDDQLDAMMQNILEGLMVVTLTPYFTADYLRPVYALAAE